MRTNRYVSCLILATSILTSSCSSSSQSQVRKVEIPSNLASISIPENSLLHGFVQSDLASIPVDDNQSGVDESFDSLKEVDDPIPDSEGEARLLNNVFSGTIYTSQLGIRDIISAVEKNISVQDHCKNIDCYVPTYSEPEENVGPMGQYKVSRGQYKNLYMTLSTDVYSDSNLQERLGEIVHVYRTAFDGWTKYCPVTLLIAPSKFNDYDGTRIQVDADIGSSAWSSTILCNQFFYDGEKYHAIDITGSQVRVFDDSKKRYIKLNLNNQPIYFRETEQFYVYDTKSNGAYVSLDSDFRRDAYFEKYGGTYVSPKLNDIQEEADPEVMILDFLKNGHTSQYATALSIFLPMQVYYEDKSDSFVYILNYNVPSVDFGFESTSFDDNSNCSIYKAYYGKYLTPEGLYHCLYELEDGWKRVHISRSKVLNIPLGPNSPKLSGQTLKLRDDGTFEVYTTFVNYVSNHVSGKVYPQPNPDFFRKMRNGDPFTEDEMPEEGFESCVKERDGLRISCSFFEATDPEGC